MSFFSHIFKRKRPKRTYLDHAAATPLRRSVEKAMKPYWRDVYGNPGAVHKEGQRAAEAVDEARKETADVLSVRPDEVTFTSGGTEANNLALFGVVSAARQKGIAPEDIEIISTEIEHPSITEALEVLKQDGVTVKYVSVDQDGRIQQNELEELLSPRTTLISFSYVNSEVGTVEDVKRITRLVRKYRKEHETQVPFVHLDAAQAPLWLSCEVDRLGVNLMSLDSGKFYGPKGAGVLVRKRTVPIVPHIHGGGQESELRSGTENVPLIVGFAKSLKEAQHTHEQRAEKILALRDQFKEMLMQQISGITVNGSEDHRVANNLNISIKGIDGEYTVVDLDIHGVAASTKSACGSTESGGSAVVRALSGDDARAHSTIRFTLGEETTIKELEKATETLATHVALARTETERSVC